MENQTIMRCYRKNCPNPAHELSRYCFEHLQRKKSERQLKWERDNAEEIKKDLKAMKENMWGGVDERRKVVIDGEELNKKRKNEQNENEQKWNGF